MNIGKTNYTFQFEADASVVENIVKSWLVANKFKLVNKCGEDFYYYNDPVLYGKRGFQYVIDGNTISVDAWTIGIGKKYYMLESGAINNMAGDTYKSLLQLLFNKISSANCKDDDYVQTFELENLEKQKKLCDIGFILSIIGLFLSILGVSFGLIIYLLDFYFAAQGLKTTKKGKAIATIILSIVSILIILFYILT